MLSNEELIMPRYKVIADYPNSPFIVGRIITLNNFGAGQWWHEYTDEEPIHLDANTKKYPAVLQKLEWYEQRDVSDLPKYLKDAFVPETSEFHKVYKIELYNIITFTIVTNTGEFTYHEYLKSRVPATEEEYLAYQTRITCQQ